MRILIAGGGGYIGTKLTKQLIEQGHLVTVIDLFWFGDYLPKSKQITKITKNLFDCDDNDFKNIEQVIFLAGLSNDPMANFSPNLNFIYNSSLPLFLGYLSKKNNVRRFIYASSCSVYGYTNEIEVDEQFIPNCDSPYGISKYAGEQSLYYLQDINFSIICLRMGTVCGYSERMRFDTVINAMFKDAILTNTISVNNKDIYRPILSIKDACNAYIKSINVDYNISGIFNISSVNISIGELSTKIANHLYKLSGKLITINIKNIPDNRNYVIKIEKAANILNFIPNYNIEDIVEELYINLDNYKHSLDNNIYYNIKIFKNTIKGTFRNE